MAGNVLEFSDATFESDVLGSTMPVIVDFWAPWCPPCRALAPTIEKIAGAFQGRVKVGKLDTDQNQVTAANYRVSSIPTIIFFQGGKEVDRLVGQQGESAFRDRIAKLGVSLTV